MEFYNKRVVMDSNTVIDTNSIETGNGYVDFGSNRHTKFYGSKTKKIESGERTISLPQLEVQSESGDETISNKGDRIIVLAAGGASLGGIVAQIPGAAVGAIIGCVFGLVTKGKESSS